MSGVFTIKISGNPYGFEEGSVQAMKGGGVGKPMLMYVRKTRNGATTMTTLRRTWIGQIIQVFIFRLKDR